MGLWTKNINRSKTGEERLENRVRKHVVNCFPGICFIPDFTKNHCELLLTEDDTHIGYIIICSHTPLNEIKKLKCSHIETVLYSSERFKHVLQTSEFKNRFIETYNEVI